MGGDVHNTPQTLLGEKGYCDTLVMGLLLLYFSIFQNGTSTALTKMLMFEP